MTLQEIKKYFFTYRDGLTADVLRRGGVNCKTIFGLQIPQISALARSAEDMPAAERQKLAEVLWADKDVRESRLLACYLFQPELLSIDEALMLANDVRWQEEADILSFRLLRRVPDVALLMDRLPQNAPVLTALQRIL